MKRMNEQSSKKVLNKKEISLVSHIKIPSAKPYRLGLESSAGKFMGFMIQLCVLNSLNFSFLERQEE
jgi:hypothetical protein